MPRKRHCRGLSPLRARATAFLGVVVIYVASGCKEEEVTRYKVPKEPSAPARPQGPQRLLGAIAPHGDRISFFKPSGPRMAADALAPLCSDGKTGLRVHFVSNPDAWALHSTLRGLDPKTTMVIVASKTFTTQETMTNAASARRWLEDGGITGAAQSAHLVAITAAPQKSGAAGYPAEHTFTFWDWVGGRYSVWSALGMPLALAIGSKAFREFLAGGPKHVLGEFVQGVLNRQFDVVERCFEAGQAHGRKCQLRFQVDH